MNAEKFKKRKFGNLENGAIFFEMATEDNKMTGQQFVKVGDTIAWEMQGFELVKLWAFEANTVVAVVTGKSYINDARIGVICRPDKRLSKDVARDVAILCNAFDAVFISTGEDCPAFEAGSVTVVESSGFDEAHLPEDYIVWCNNEVPAGSKVSFPVTYKIRLLG